MQNQQNAHNTWQGFLTTPSLWPQRFWQGLSHFDWKKIKVLADQNDAPTDLPENLVLGKTIEWCFANLLMRSKRHCMIEHGLQVFDEHQRTIGEIDFLMKDLEAKRVIHLEFVYKFYLAVGQSGHLDSWVGPNQKDAFVYKLQKLVNQQFPLISHTSCKTLLNERGIDPSILDQQICFLGQLYLPVGFLESEIPFNREAIAGLWYRLEHFEGQFGDADLFFIPEKSMWVHNPRLSVDWKSKADIKAQLKNLLARQWSPMLWHKKADGSLHRLFVVWW